MFIPNTVPTGGENFFSLEKSFVDKIRFLSECLDSETYVAIDLKHAQ